MEDSGPASWLSAPMTQDTWVYSEPHSVLLGEGGVRPSSLTRMSPAVMERSHSEPVGPGCFRGWLCTCSLSTASGELRSLGEPLELFTGTSVGPPWVCLEGLAPGADYWLGSPSSSCQTSFPAQHGPRCPAAMPAPPLLLNSPCLELGAVLCRGWHAPPPGSHLALGCVRSTASI